MHRSNFSPGTSNFIAGAESSLCTLYQTNRGHTPVKKTNLFLTFCLLLRSSAHGSDLRSTTPVRKIVRSMHSDDKCL